MIIMDHFNQDELSELIYEDLLDEMFLGLYFKVHRSCKLGLLFLGEQSVEEEKKYEIVEQKGLDIFGHNSAQMKKQYECVCPSCQRNLSAQRFAPHLEKCMGMGRNSSRIASKRIASVTGKCNEDSDFEAVTVRKVKKKKVTKRSSNHANGSLNNGVHSA